MIALSPAVAAASATGGGEGSTAPAAEAAAGFPSVMADTARDAALPDSTGRSIREQNDAGGTPLPDGGNLLPLLASPPLPVAFARAAAAPLPVTEPSTTAPAAARPPATAAFRAASRSNGSPVPDGRAETPERESTPFPALLGRPGGTDAMVRSAGPADASGETDGRTGMAGASFAGPSTAAPETSQTGSESFPVEDPAEALASTSMAAVVDGDPEAPGARGASADRLPRVVQDAGEAPAADTRQSTSADLAGYSAAQSIVPEPRPEGSSDSSAAPDLGAADRASSGPSSFAVATAAADPPRQPDRPVVMQLATGVSNPEWADGLADRVNWMVQQDFGQAHLKLNPPQLGPVEVRVQVSGDQATVAFTAHNQQARDALEGASQRLRDLLGAQGFINVQVDVNQQAFHERPLLPQPYDEGPLQAGSQGGTTAVTTVVRNARGLLDAYA